MKKLNILYLHSHDTGRYIQPYGYAVPTPNLQKLAEGSVLFRKAFCANPTCSPSRAALLTGMCAHGAGMMGLAHRGFALADYSKHLVQVLRDRAGYKTVLCGVQHETSGPGAAQKVIGYQRVLDAGDDNRGRVVAEFLRSKPEGPFFLSAGFNQTHRGFPDAACDEALTDPRYVQPPTFLPDTPETRADMAAYNTKARDLDTQYGQILDALEESGLADSTIVLCTTDHGVAFPFGKCHLTDHGTGVLMMLRGPKGSGLEGGKVVDGMVSQVDVFPTLCELIGMEKPDWLEGVSMMPLIEGSAKSIREEVFAEVNYHAAYEPMRSVRTERYKYIKRYDGREKPVLPNCDNSPSKTLVHEAGWMDRGMDEEMLFDLLFDPQESNNLIDNPALAGVAEEMRGRLDGWMKRTNDPLLDGPIPLPEGAFATPTDNYSPEYKP